VSQLAGHRGCDLVSGKHILLYCAIKYADWVWYPPAVIGASLPIVTAYGTKIHRPPQSSAKVKNVGGAKPPFAVCLLRHAA